MGVCAEDCAVMVILSLILAEEDIFIASGIPADADID